MSTSTNLRAAIDEIRDGLIFSERERKEVVEKLDREYQRKALERLCQRIGALPWWVISGGLHAALFLLIGVLAVATTPAAEPAETIIIRDVLRTTPPPFNPPPVRPLFSAVPAPAPGEGEIAMPAPDSKPGDVDDRPSPFNEPGLRGDPAGLGEIGEPALSTGVTGVLGMGEGGGPGAGFGIRTDRRGKEKLIRRYGGDGTESAVEAALKWLARHQEADGHWDPRKYEATEDNPWGVTGLALLAFLGSGHTEKSGPFADTVRRAEQWLLKQQQPNGAFSANGRLGYNHAIAGLALAEAYGMGQDPEIGRAAQKAVNYSIKEHQCPYSGWRYGPKESPDTSVTGWFVMQLKSAKIAGLSVDGAGFQGATAWLDRVTGKDGGTGYTSASQDACMTAVGMVSRQFMGTSNDNPLLVGGAGILAKALPEWKDGRGHGRERGFYYWYYGTLAMFQMGGEHWAKWNEKLKPTLLKNQCKGPLPLGGGADDKDGSWDPESWIDPYGGRVMTTAMGALTLEVYYRYLPMYGR